MELREAMRYMHIYVAAVIYFVGTAGVHASEMERLLLATLLKDYDVNERPVRNNSDKVTVSIDMGLRQIIELNERNQDMTIKAWLRTVWTDEYLTWDPAQYGGITNIRIFPDRIWRPDITLYNDLSERLPLDEAKYFPAQVFHTGRVRWPAPQILKSSCNVDVKLYPWDRQVCPLQFGSWTYHGFEIDLVNVTYEGDLSVFEENGEWQLDRYLVSRNAVYYNCCLEPYPDVTFIIHMSRKPLFYIFNLVLPSIFIMATTILVFYLPPESGEKVSLGVTVLLALTVFLLLVAESMPPQSDSIPLMGQYFGSTIILMAISCSVTVLIINLHHRGSHGSKVPRWVRVIVLNWMARLLFLKDTVDRNISHPVSEETNGTEVIVNGDAVILNSMTDKKKETLSNQQYVSTTDRTLKEILDVLTDFRHSRKVKEKEEACASDWMMVATVIDRFFLLLFFLLHVVITATILTNH